MGKQVDSGNGVTETSVLGAIKEEWQKKGSKVPSKADRDKLVETFKEARKKSEAAATALEEAKEAEHAATLAMCKATGGQSIRIDGVVHDFASKGATVFFRRKSGDVLDF